MREGTIGRIQSPLQADLERIADTVVDTLSVDFALLSVTNNSHLFSLGLSSNLVRAGQERRHVPSDLVCLHVVETDAPLVLPDARADPVFNKVRYVENGTVTGYLGVPIQNAEIGPIGAVCGVTSAPRNWQHSDLQYMKAVSQTVEGLILREMHRLECVDADTHAPESDKIIAAFSLMRAAPTSIHDRTGRLVFANAALTECVSVAELQSKTIARRLTASVTADPLHVQARKSGVTFEIRRVETSSGYFVCQWTPLRERMN